MPTQGDVREKWIDAIKMHQGWDENAGQMDICELHFLDEQIIRKKKRNHLIKGGSPSVFPTPHQCFQNTGAESLDR